MALTNAQTQKRSRRHNKHTSSARANKCKQRNKSGNYLVLMEDGIELAPPGCVIDRIRIIDWIELEEALRTNSSCASLLDDAEAALDKRDKRKAKQLKLASIRLYASLGNALPSSVSGGGMIRE